jgi:hypothetical protein
MHDQFNASTFFFFLHLGEDAWDLHYHAKGSIVRLGCQWFMLINVDDMPVFIEFF